MLIFLMLLPSPHFPVRVGCEKKPFKSRNTSRTRHTPMQIDKNTRIVTVPTTPTSYEILNIPSPVDMSSKSILSAGNSLFELREINGSNPVKSKNTTLPQSSTTVKSWVFENPEALDARSSGYILQSPNMTVSSKYDLTYTILAFLCSNDKFSQRFFTCEDFVDTVSDSCRDGVGIDWIQKLEHLFASILKSLCETLNENEEEFYKYSTVKTYAFLLNKINKLLQYLKTNPSAIFQKEKNKLVDIEGKIPSDISDELAIKVAFELVNSYCSDKIKAEMAALEPYTFTKLKAYERDLQQKKRDLAIAEQSMNAVAEASSRAAGGKKKAPPVKKAPKKVAVGKGALDSFFKKG